MSEDARITLGHGAGGRLTQRLIRELFLPAYGNEMLEPLGDAALLPATGGALAFTTDGFVVSPLFFPGGDIGCLSVYGTVNDLAVAGARPLWLSLGMIIEEGLPLEDLRRVARSVRDAAARAGVQVVTGDTKVVERGKGDGLFITTAGVGLRRGAEPPRPLQPGDAILVSGPLGDHGAVILSRQRGIRLESELLSDCAPVTPLVDALFAAGMTPLFLRDPTRGGLCGVLADLAGEDDPAAALAVEADEGAIPVRPAVAAIGEITGIDPLHLACEGRVVAVVAEDEAARALAAWRALPEGRESALIGRMDAGSPGRVALRTILGGRRLLLRPAADPLPRIC
jgi:hydrogenase expression/formation protein HypE